MVREALSSGVYGRFETHIDELRNFLASRGVPFGHAGNLVQFAEEFSAPGSFNEEMGSILRSIVYMESEHIGRAELLEILTLTVGGVKTETASPEMQPAIRAIFLALNSALRSQQSPFADLDDPEADIDDGSGAVDSILSDPPPPAAPRQRWEELEEPSSAPVPQTPMPPAMERPASPVQTTYGRLGAARLSRSPETSEEPSFAEAPPRAQPGSHIASQPAAPREMLYQALNMAAANDSFVAANDLFVDNSAREDDLPPPPGRRPWLIPAIAVGLAVIGIGITIARPIATTHAHTPFPAAPITRAVTPSSQGLTSASCVAPLPADVSRPGLDERSRWAHNLLDQKLYSAALPELQEVATLDPGYPGILLDESNALLNLHQAEAARTTIDQQISLSNCLEQLSPPALDAYCRTQYPDTFAGGCQAQLTHIRQQSEIQAALVHLELGHRVQPEMDAEAASLAELTDNTPDPVQSPPARRRRRPVLPHSNTSTVRARKTGSESAHRLR